MILEESVSYKCKCSKCSHIWSTKTDRLPKVCANCQSKLWNAGYEKPKAKTLVDQIKDLKQWQREALFEEFELCCKTVRGNCICEHEEIEAPAANPAYAKLAALGVRTGAEFFAKGKPEVPQTPAEAIEDHWVFAKQKPQYADDGSVYRLQWLAPLYKRPRTVEVDESDLDKIIGVVK